jgi:hypothetical protein
MKIRLLMTSFTLAMLVVSCGSYNDKRQVKDYLSAFIKENHSVAIFGKVDINTLLNKAEYKSVPKFGTIIESVLNEFSKSIDTKEPIYYAVEGPFKADATPAAFYAFIAVSSADSLVANLVQKGYDFEKDGDLNFAQFGELSIGIKKDLAIIISKNSGSNVKESIEKAFEISSGDVSGGRVDAILSQNGDIVLGCGLEALYTTSDTQLSKLDQSKQDEIRDLVVDSYSQTIFDFDDGQVIIETNNFFSESLKKRMFLKANEKASILSNLGHGSPILGFSFNFDIEKLQSFVNDFSPEALNKMSETLDMQGPLMMLGENPLSGISNGQLGLVMLGEPGKNGSMVPDFNIYIGLGKKGKPLAEMAKSFLSNGSMVTSITNNAICCYSSINNCPAVGKKLIIPRGCEGFGKKAMTGFVNFEGMDLSTFDLEGGAKILNIIKYVNFEVDENGARICIKAKKGKENVLKQSINFFLQEFESQISGMSI